MREGAGRREGGIDKGLEGRTVTSVTPTARWEASLSKLLGEDHIMWRLLER